MKVMDERTLSPERASSDSRKKVYYASDWLMDAYLLDTQGHLWIRGRGLHDEDVWWCVDEDELQPREVLMGQLLHCGSEEPIIVIRSIGE